ncbi:MAG: serine hydrolase [Prosthecobacter sp.]|uniref:serine hydrolase n=1 Tax=Prosthecobacter sp. TaxID=1965333 RepID=UPI0025DA5571|nr:serine hydrolase [Prosthecobacter sp.]MCF7785348.1 serine hydrolase [Prosthecobacter sp.]
MKFISWVLLGLVMAVNSVQARPLADAAAQFGKHLKAGCIVTGEGMGDDVKFAIVGSAPEAGDLPPEKLVFEIGFITKVFTGLLLAQAVVEKKVTLDATLGSLLAGKVKFTDPRVAAITLKQLATHTSGLPRLPDNAVAGALEEDPYASYDEKLLLNYLAGAKLDGEGLFTLSYSNLGAGLLGHLLGEVYHMSWDQAVVEKICKPLGMQDTAVQPPARLRLATPHDGDKETKPWHFISMAGCGALRSTAADMMTFGEALLHPDRTSLKEAFALALQPQADAPSQGGQIGLGVLMGKFEGEATLHHDGGTGGFCSGLQVIPAKGIVRVVLINNNSIAGGQVIARTSEVKPVDPATQKEITLPADLMKQYPGVYDLDRDFRFTVLLRDGQIYVRLTGQPFLPVSAKATDRFFNKVVAAEIAFNRREGEIQSLTLFQNGNELTAKRSSTAPPEYQLRSAKELQPYVGKYDLMGSKALAITVQADTLFAQIDGQPALPVFETAPDRFEYDAVKAALVFTRNDKQQINGLTFLQNGLTVPAPRVKTPTSVPKP